MITSSNGSPYNTIDPSLVRDGAGHVWMAFGSYWSGIYVVQLDALTGLRIAPSSPTYQVANNSSIEASYLWQHGSYFYLFVNWGSCCSGVNSTYNIRVGRSTSVTGPYLDRNGMNMANGGGSLFLQGTGKYTGPGHVGIFSEGGTDWLSYHYYDANSWAPQYGAYGTADFSLLPLSWSDDGWPVVTNDWSAIYNFQADARDENGQYSGLLQNGAAVIPDPAYGHVLDLNGTNQFVWLPPGVGYGQTFVAVVKWRGGGPWQRIFDFGFDTSKTVMMTPASGDNVLRCDINPGGNLQIIQWTNPLPTNVWTHVALTLNGSQGVLYVNGTPVVTNRAMNLLPLYVAPQTNHLGRSKFSADACFNGQYASFRAYGRALSPAEIVAPLPSISQPATGAGWWPGKVISFSGSATDFADRPLDASHLTWQINFAQNGGTNVVFGPVSGVANGTFNVPSNTPAAGNYIVVLSVTDNSNRQSSVSSVLAPTNSPAPWSSYYPFTSGAQDASNLYSGTLRNGASIVNDPGRGSVLNLSGASQYVSLPAGVGAAQTVSGWVKWNGGNSWQRVFDFGRNNNDFFFLTTSDAAGLIQCAITPNLSVYNQVIESPSPMPLNQWTHMAVVMDGRQGVLYLNGKAVAVNNSVNLLPSDLGANNCSFGKSQFSNDPYFSGRLSAFRLNSGPLPVEQLIAPVPVITQPTAGFLFAGGQPLNFAGTATDYSGTPLGPGALTWSGELYSNGLAAAAFGPLSNQTSGSYLVPTNATTVTNVFYRIRLSATDTNGYQQTVTRDVQPLLSQVSFATVPSDLLLTLDGQPVSTTAPVDAVVGMARLVGAPSPQVQGGSNYDFVVWSDGGPPSHYILVPPTNATFTASYVRPELDLRMAVATVQLTWPSWAASMQLCSTPDLAPPVTWSPVTNPPVLSLSNCTLTLPATNGTQFYRLQLH